MVCQSVCDLCQLYVLDVNCWLGMSGCPPTLQIGFFVMFLCNTKSLPNIDTSRYSKSKCFISYASATKTIVFELLLPGMCLFSNQNIRAARLRSYGGAPSTWFLQVSEYTPLFGYVLRFGGGGSASNSTIMVDRMIGKCNL